MFLFLYDCLLRTPAEEEAVSMLEWAEGHAGLDLQEQVQTWYTGNMAFTVFLDMVNSDTWQTWFLFWARMYSAESINQNRFFLNAYL